MPCVSPEVFDWQIRAQKTAALLCFVRAKRDMGGDARVNRVAGTTDIGRFDADYVTAQLCEIMRRIPPHERDELMYDARNKASRALADWWEEHTEADQRRERREREEAAEKSLAREVAAKLSPEELYAVVKHTPVPKR